MSGDSLPAVYASLLGYDCSPRDEKPACACTHLHYRCDPRLCQQAYTLSSTVKSFVAEPRWPVEFTFNVLAQASFRCPTCAILHAGLTLADIRSKWDTALNMNERTKYDYYERCIVKVLDDRGNVDVEDGSYTRHSFVFKVQDAASLKTNCKVFSSATAQINDSTGSYLSFKNLRAWITACANHPVCTPMTPVELPSRVIDVFHNPQTSNVRLHETHGEIGQYITLSHCWGPQSPSPSPSLKLTKSNLATFLVDIDWRLMPQTFLDAINIARNLRIHYLWIDALCIIQDDAKDWEAETAKMGSTYQHSLLTIAASHAANSRAGCFHPITAGPVRMRTIPTPSNSSRPSGITISDVLDRHDLFHPSARRPQDEEPLLDRAWVLQERLLSPRVVHYTSRELIWECASATRCQCNRARFDESSNLRIKLARQNPSPSPGNITSAVQLWLHVVEEYTQRRLTYPADRLPAISGLAKYFATRGLRTYLAGLWLEDLPLSLIWTQKRDTPASSVVLQPRPTPPISRSSSKASSRLSIFIKPADDPSYTAPSWSWASVEGPLSFFHSAGSSTLDGGVPQQRPCISIQHAECKPTTVDPTGRVRGGTLKLSGQLLRIFELIPPDVAGGFAALRKRRGDGALVYVSLDERGEIGVPSTRVGCILWSVPAEEGDGKSASGGDAWVMVVAESRRVRGAMERIGMARMPYRARTLGSGEVTAAEWFVGAEERVVVLV